METVGTMGDMLMRQYPTTRKKAKGKQMGGLMIGPGSPPSGPPQPQG